MPIFDVKLKRRCHFYEEASLPVEANSAEEAVAAAAVILEDEEPPLDWSEVGSWTFGDPSVEFAVAVADEDDDAIVEEE